MTHIKKTAILITFLFATSSLLAYKIKHKDKKYNKENPPESVFRLDGVIFSGYEFLDHNEVGEVDAAGPSKEKSGFKIGRAYLNIRGKVGEGNWKGWGFRITTDISPLGKQVDSKTADIPSNDYNVYLKYALVKIPVPVKGLKFILGQQHVPGVDGKGGVSLQSFWGHRYVEKAATEYLGMSSSTDRGLGMTYYNKDMPFFGLHLLFANGEGYHHNNAEGVQTNQTILKDLSAGKDSSRSYGMDLYGMPSFIPTGDKKDLRVAISFPFRLQNIYGMDAEEESKTTIINVAQGTTPSMVTYQGDTRAKRDYSYGSELDVEYTRGELQLGLGAGGIVKVDRRGNAYKIDDTFHEILLPGLPSSFTDHVNLDQDQKGFARYVFAHVRYLTIGVFGRYTIATSSSKLSRKFGTSSSKGWAQQMLEADALDDILGNLDHAEATNNYDTGKAKTRTFQLGVTWYMSPTFRVSLGVSDLWGDKPSSGKHFKDNPLDRVKNAAGDTVAQQLEADTSLASSLGVNSFDTDDYTGRTAHDKQAWIRTEFKF